MKTTILALGLEFAANAAQGLEVYKNASACVQDRVEDLLGRMNLEEKAGLMFHMRLFQAPNGTLDEGATGDDAPTPRNSTHLDITQKMVNHFNLVGEAKDARIVAQVINEVQHSGTDNILIGAPAGRSQRGQRPSASRPCATQLSCAARLRSRKRNRLGYRALLVTLCRHLQRERRADQLATCRNTDPDGDTSIGTHSVTTVSKHFPDGGTVVDPHFTVGKNQTYPGNNFEHHLIPFRRRRPIGTKYPPIAFVFNREIITDLLRNEMGFDGIVLSDWMLITDSYTFGEYTHARAWRAEHLSELERVAMILDASVDEFGGKSRPELIVQLVDEEQPYVDVEAATRIVGSDYFKRLGVETQQKSCKHSLPIAYISFSTSKLAHTS
ncbi:glycoside hydrolase superfamily [Pterulicium gracile]|uniref:Glycoside hydrolase superfamily n=1 Tax=Pterulicium gracile TaxID=1884261 RepID=A0A5C3QTG6_9AGAR|nr:glycoside hydrolase superfamily [Pterula gracilis]